MTTSLDELGRPEDESTFRMDASAQDSAPGDVQPPILDEERNIAQDGEVEQHEVKVDASGDDVSWFLDQQQSIAQDDSVQEGAETADNRDASGAAVEKEMKKEIQDAEEWRPPSLKSAAQAPSLPQAPPNTVPATPIKQIRDAIPSPQTEEIHREDTNVAREHLFVT